MLVTFAPVKPSCSKGKSDNSQLHAGEYAVDDNHHPNRSRNNRTRSLRRSLFKLVWNERFGQWLYRRFWYKFHNYNPWKFLSIRDRDKSSRSSRNHRHSSNHHYKRYYYLLICLLAISPVRSEEGEVNNTSNPQAAATGNVSNQAIQFQNNGAPSRQQMGPSIVCNGSVLTFSPFYMGNHVKPFDDGMQQESYTINENWGMQLNFMVPLDGSIVEQCKSIARRQEEKMRLDYELVRIKECAALQAKGFTLRPGSRLEHICADVVPISAVTKIEPLSLDGVEFFSQPAESEALKFEHTF